MGSTVRRFVGRSLVATLTRECAQLVRRHRVRLARDVSDATALLRSNRATASSTLASFGRVGRELLEMGDR